jgi:hypothetical protein
LDGPDWIDSPPTTTATSPPSPARSAPSWTGLVRTVNATLGMTGKHPCNS